MEGDGYEKRQQSVKQIIDFYLEEYQLRPEDNDDVKNALNFYKEFLSGRFVQFTDDVIVLRSTTFKVRSYSKSTDGDWSIRSELLKEPKDIYFYPAKGFWMSAYLTQSNLNHPKFRLGKIR